MSKSVPMLFIGYCLVTVNGQIGVTDIDECKSNPCQNGATCVDGVNIYACNCVTGYEGNNCENIHTMEDCNCFTQLIVIGACLGLNILILLVYAGYTTISIRRIGGRQEGNTSIINERMLQLNVDEIISAGVAANLIDKNEQNQAKADQCNGHMTPSTESSVLNQGYEHNGEMAIETSERKDLIAQSYAYEPCSAEVSANWKHGNIQNKDVPAFFIQGDMHNKDREGGHKGCKSHLYANEYTNTGVSEVNRCNDQDQTRAMNYTDIEYLTLDERLSDNSTYTTLGANI